MPSAIAIKQIEGKPGKVYYPLEKITIPSPAPKDNEVPTSPDFYFLSTNAPRPL
jgi:hypothetical protein